jgi:hypothetical protein
MIKWIRPTFFFVSFILSFIFCCILGYVVNSTARLNHFVRFFSYISPAVDYYPTSGELLATAKHDVDKNKILVLIGGSSIFRGDGQNSDDLWSSKLQKILGDQYKVLNYASNGAGFASFGGVAYRILKEHYPKIIFVATCSYADDNSIEGNYIYKYLFWDAYYKKLFHPNITEQQQIDNLKKQEMASQEGVEFHLMSYLDSIFYFKNLWNWVTYRFGYTIWSNLTRDDSFKARRKFIDIKYDNLALANEIGRKRFPDEVKMISNDAHLQANIDLTTNQYKPTKAKKLYQQYNDLFTPEYRSKILCFFPTYNPRLLSALSVNDQKAYKILIKETASIVKLLGYNVMHNKNMIPDDYVDLMHYLASGGDKLAKQMVPEITIIAKKNHYFDKEIKNYNI